MANAVAGAVIWNFEADMKALESALREAQSKVSSADKTIQKNIDSSMKNVESSVRSAGKSIEGLGNGLIKIGAIPTAALGLAAKAAIDYESAFAGVRKTVDASEEDFAK